MRLNMKKLKEAIHDIHREIKAQKGEGPSGPPTAYRLKVLKQQQLVNEMGTKPGWLDEWRKLSDLRNTKLYATILYSIRANNRNKLHQQTVRNPYAGMSMQPPTKQYTIEEQQKLIAPYIHEFEDQRETIG